MNVKSIMLFIGFGALLFFLFFTAIFMAIPTFFAVIMLYGSMLGILVFVSTYAVHYVVVPRLYPLRIPIAIQRGKSVVWDLDERAKHKKEKDGYESLILMKRGHSIKPPKFERVTLDTKGRPVYPIFNTTIGQYFPMLLKDVPDNLKEYLKKYYNERGVLKNPNKKIIKPIKLMEPPKIEVVEDKSAKNWAIEALKRNEARYAEKPSKFLQYAPYIMNATFAAMVIFFVIYFGGRMEMVAGSLSNAANALTGAVQMMSQAPPMP